MKNTCWIIFFLCLASSSSSQVASNADSKKPNVLFISVDDLNDWINTKSSTGRSRIKTPNFDGQKIKGLFQNTINQLEK